MSHYSALCIASLLAVATADCNAAFGNYNVACLNALKCDDYKTGACGPAVAKVRQECACSALDKLKIQSLDKVFNAVCKTSGGTTRPGTGGTNGCSTGGNSVVTKPPSGGDVCAAARGAVRL